MSQKKNKAKGKRRMVWLPEQLDRKAEEVRKALGLGRSGFYRFAIVEVIKQFVPVQEESKHEEGLRNG